MKIMNLPFLRHKLQWFLLLAAMLTVSQGVWGATYTIYFQRPSSWTNTPNIHVWGSSGDACNNCGMAHVSGSWYKKDISTNDAKVSIIFNNGGWNNGQSNTKSDWTPVSNTYFTCNGSSTNITVVDFSSYSRYVTGNGWGGMSSWASNDKQMSISGHTATYTFSSIEESCDKAFKVTDGTWNNTWGWSDVSSTTKSTYGGAIADWGSDNNVKLCTTVGSLGTRNVTITIDLVTNKIDVSLTSSCSAPSKPSVSAPSSVCSGVYPQVTVSSSLSTVSYQLFLSDGTTPRSNASDGDGDNLTLTATTSLTANTSYKVKAVANCDASKSTLSDAFTVNLGASQLTTASAPASFTTKAVGSASETKNYSVTKECSPSNITQVMFSESGTGTYDGFTISNWNNNSNPITFDVTYDYAVAETHTATLQIDYGTNSHWTREISATAEVVTRVYANVSGPNWGSPYFYYWNSSKQALGSSWRGDAMTSDGNGWYHFDIPPANVAAATGGGFIINGSDSDKTGDLSLPAGFSAGDTYCITVASNKSVTPFPAAPTATLQNGVSENTVCAGTAPVFRVTAPLTAGFKYQLFLSNGTAASSEYTAAAADVLAGHIDVTASSGIAAGNSSTYYVLVTANSPNSCKTASSSNITVSGTAPSLITASAPAFSNKLVGSSETQTFSVTKACNPEGITQVKFSDNSSTTYNGFTISNWDNNSNPITFDVTYSYPVAGTRTATLLIEYAAGGSWTQEISATATTPTRIYYKPGTACGGEAGDYAGAWFAMYCYNNSTSTNTWYRMYSFDRETKMYYADVASMGDWQGLIICRMSDNSEAFSWDNRWNQSGDLTYNSAKNVWTASGCNGTTINGAWESTKYTPTDDEIPSMYIKGPLLTGAWGGTGKEYNNSGWDSETRVGDVFTYVKQFPVVKISGDDDCKFSLCLSTVEASDTKLGKLTIPGANLTGLTQVGENFRPTSYATLQEGDIATVTVTRNGYGWSASDFTISFAVCSPVPAITLSATSTTICANTAPALRSSSTSNVSYQLYTSDDEPVGDPVPGTGSSISFDADAITTATTYYVIGTSTVSGCESQTNTSDNLAISTTPDYTISGATSATAWKPITITTSPEQATATWSITTNPDSKGYLSTETGASTVFKGAAPGSAGTTNYIIKASVTSNNCTLDRSHTVGVVYTDCE